MSPSELRLSQKGQQEEDGPGQGRGQDLVAGQGNGLVTEYKAGNRGVTMCEGPGEFRLDQEIVRLRISIRKNGQLT